MSGGRIRRPAALAFVLLLACTPEAPEPEVVDFVREATWSPRGDRLLTTWNQGRRFRLYGVMAPDTAAAPVEPSTGLRLSDGPDAAGTWSPDRMWVAFGSTRDGQGEIYRMRPDGMQPENLTRDPADDREPAYDPAGRRIAFVSDRSDGAPRLHVMTADGADVRMVPDPPGSAHGRPFWSADGERIVVHVVEEGGDAIWISDAAGGWTRVTEGESPSWGGRGGEIWFARADSIWSGLDGEPPVPLGVEGAAPRLSPDGRWLAFVRGAWPESALWARDMETGEERRLTR